MRSKYFKTNSKRKLKGILSSEQLKKIKIDFPDSQLVKNSWDSFQIIIEIQPTAISEKYQILVNYEKNMSIRVFVIEKDLKIASNRTKLPHVYNSKQQQLCLFSPSKKEWNGFTYIVDTVIPWASEWLYYYELWLPEGQWYGGGHNEYPNEDYTNIIRDEK
jgi:RNA polymerase subunit RPABC4/transcription elongation factor Spt4